MYKHQWVFSQSNKNVHCRKVVRYGKNSVFFLLYGYLTKGVVALSQVHLDKAIKIDYWSLSFFCCVFYVRMKEEKKSKEIPIIFMTISREFPQKTYICHSLMFFQASNLSTCACIVNVHRMCLRQQNKALNKIIKIYYHYIHS